MLGFSFFGDSEEVNDDVNEELKQAIFDKKEKILSACLNCWNDFDVFRAREYFFTTLGTFSYNDEDRNAIEKKITGDRDFQSLLQQRATGEFVHVDKDGNQRIDQPKSSAELLTSYLDLKFNSIQRSLIELLKDFTLEHPQDVVRGFLSVWDQNIYDEGVATTANDKAKSQQ